MAVIKSLLVFCGSSMGNDPVYAKSAFETGVYLAQQGIRIVYGGAKVGLMGALADGALSQDGKVVGVLPEFLKNKGLKIALVYEHEKGHFEVWLSARNREISKRLEPEFTGSILNGIPVFHDAGNQDAIIECTLVSKPDFDDQVLLTDTICQSAQVFIDAVCKLL